MDFTPLEYKGESWYNRGINLIYGIVNYKKQGTKNSPLKIL